MTDLRQRLRASRRLHRRTGHVGLLLLGITQTLLTAIAQSPHEVLVLVNRNHPDSIALANAFVHTRKVPPVNVLELDLPPAATAINSAMSLAQFREWIWEPANQAIRARQLNEHVWTWVYSAGFPLRCTEPPGLSLTGITFSKGVMPDPNAVKGGRALSPMFAGPTQSDQPALDTASSVWTAAELGEDAPIPSMVLGHTGARGTTLDTALDVIHRGVASDFSHPAKPGVFFVTSKDVRSTCRQWQFPTVADALKERRFHARVTGAHPTGARSILGLLYGRNAMPETAHYDFLPGAMAEHLTSFAGAFWVFYQTKLSYWLRKGATASCGTVVEPMALWPKFPHARFFEHYAHGTSMLESFYLSVASPYQLLMMGEPLARPFATPLVANWRPDDPARPHTYSVSVTGVADPWLCQFLLNGRPLTPLSPTTSITVHPADLPDGVHELRAAVSTVTPVRRHTQLIRSLVFGRRSLRLSSDSPVALGSQMSLRVDPSHPVSGIRVLKGETELAVQDGTDDIRIDSHRLGLGHSRLHVEATFPGGGSARSDVLDVEVLPPDDPIAPFRPDDYRPIDTDWIPQKAATGHPVEQKWGKVWVTPGRTKTAIVLFDAPSSNRWEALTTTIGWKAKSGVPGAEGAGIVFNYRDKGHYDFFGLHRGAGWRLLTRNGNDIVIHDEQGAPVFLGDDYVLELEALHPQGLIGRVAGHAVVRWEEGRVDARPFGLLAADREPTRFSKSGMR